MSLMFEVEVKKCDREEGGGVGGGVGGPASGISFGLDIILSSGSSAYILCSN